MTLRSCGRDTVPITGPRSRALAAPQRIGKLSLAPGAGCEVIRIWSTRLERVILMDPEVMDPEMATARLSRRACSSTVRLVAAAADRRSIVESRPDTTAIH